MKDEYLIYNWYGLQWESLGILSACLCFWEAVEGCLMPTAVGTEQLAASSSLSQESARFTPGFGFISKSSAEPAMKNDTDGQGRDTQQRHWCQTQWEGNVACAISLTAQKYVNTPVVCVLVDLWGFGAAAPVLVALPLLILLVGRRSGATAHPQHARKGWQRHSPCLSLSPLPRPYSTWRGHHVLTAQECVPAAWGQGSFFIRRCFPSESMPPSPSPNFARSTPTLHFCWNVSVGKFKWLERNRLQWRQVLNFSILPCYFALNIAFLLCTGINNSSFDWNSKQKV